MSESVVRLHLTTQRSFPELSRWLTPRELRAFERIKRLKHRRDWLAGRRAAKELLQQYLYEEAGLKLTPLHIEIMHDENGAPYARLPTGPLGLCLSLAHSAGHGLAGISLSGSLGVDLQYIRPVRPDLAERVLTEHERAQLIKHFQAPSPLCSPLPRRGEGMGVRERGIGGRVGDEGLLVLWALKEAATKAQRTRPAPPLHEISVTLREPRCAEIFVRDRALTAQWGRWGEFIWAWAVG